MMVRPLTPIQVSIVLDVGLAFLSAKNLAHNCIKLYAAWSCKAWFAMSEKSEIKSLSFEKAASELDQIVSQLESGQIELEKAIDLYSRGVALKEHCEKKLNEAKLKVEKIVLKDGRPESLEPLDPQLQNV